MARLVGTFLTTQLDSSGDFAARSLFAFHDDGTVSAVVSRQASGETGTSFSSQLGTYECNDESSAVATLVDFGFPPAQNIGLFDMSITIGDGREISGTVTLTLMTPLEGCEPYDTEQAIATCTSGEPFETTFTGRPVRVSSR